MRRERAPRAIGCLLLLLASADALACRCAQRPLADYFDEADLVFFGEALGARELDDAATPTRVLAFSRVGDPYRWRSDAPVQRRVEILTPSSSATCGLRIDAGAVYVVFAWRDEDGAHRTDSCRGTRPVRGYDASGDDLFVDVPRRHLVAQLTALQGLDVLRDVERSAPQRTGPMGEGLIGLLAFGWQSAGEAVQLFAEPNPRSREVARVADYSRLAHRELAYESIAAGVYARRDGWYGLRTSEGEPAWARASPPMRFVPYADLVTGRLSYLTTSWSGLLWPGPGSGLPFRVAPGAPPGRAPETPVEVIDSRRVGDLLWLRVRVLAASPCAGTGTTSSTGAGWIPAYGRDGHPNAWFYSRGC